MKRRGFFRSIAAALGAVAALPLARVANAAPACTTITFDTMPQRAASTISGGADGAMIGGREWAANVYTKLAQASLQNAQLAVVELDHLSVLRSDQTQAIASIEQRLAQSSMSAVHFGRAPKMREISADEADLSLWLGCDAPIPAIEFGGLDEPSTSTSA